jgi:hypothetical protein
LRAWTQLAERYGFLVVAPTLTSAAGWWSSGGAEQIARMRNDEDRILACVRHIRAGHSISDDRIFLHGYLGGAYAAMMTGLRHSDVFRAIALSQPRFDDPLLAEDPDDMQRSVTFFEEVVRKHPLIRIRALPGPAGGPLSVRFKLFSTVELVRYDWDFGDGDSAAAAEPVHTFREAGGYRIIVRAVGREGEEYRRIATLRVPELTLGITRPGAPPES